MDLSNAVSETALATLRSRAIESQKDDGLISDPVGVELLSMIEERLGNEARGRILRRRLPRTLTAHLAIRGRQFDRFTRRFREKHPDALVVSLGAGFDTRFFRISDGPWPYVEVDLPDVIAAKKELLGERAAYTMIGCSVLDDAWLDEVQGMQTEHVLILAEGLLMYLPRDEVIGLFGKLASMLSGSEIVFETVAEKYTRGLRQKMVTAKMRRNLGTRDAVTFTYGVRTAREIETYADGITVLEEWSYLEEPDVRPGFMRIFRHLKTFTRTQWTIRAGIAGNAAREKTC